MTVDAASVEGESNLIYCVTKGEECTFEAQVKLGSLAHCTAAEAKDGVSKIKEMRKKYGKIGVIYSDNGALKVITHIVATLQSDDGEEKTIIIIIRDPAHCIDLPCKDMTDKTKCPILAEFIVEAKKIVTFISGNIRGFANEMASALVIEKPVPRQEIYPDTRMYLAGTMLKSVAATEEFMEKLPTYPPFKKYVQIFIFFSNTTFFFFYFFILNIS